MKKGRCSLCGGKLAGNRCRLCGLDNSFNDKERRYERESSVQGYVKEEKGRSDTAADIKKKNVNNYVYKPGSSLKRTKNKAKPAPKERFMKYVSTLICIVAAISGLVSYLPEIKEDILHINSSTNEEISEETDTYAYVTREIPEEGTEFEEFLGPGFYQVGVHVPEGIYQIELADGRGSMTLHDEENVIFDYSLFGTDGVFEDEVVEKDDMRLYNGATFKIGEGVVLKLKTSNGQPLKQEFIENPLKDTIPVSGEYTVGADEVQEGIYNIRITSDEGSATITYKEGVSDYIWMEKETHQTEDMVYEENGCKNVVLPKGATVLFEGDGIYLEPCEDYYEVDYNTYSSRILTDSDRNC